MNCQKCGLDFPEKEVDTSHDVPCYMFPGRNRQEKKQFADKYGGHNLCQKCPDIYEGIVTSEMIKVVPEDIKQNMILKAVRTATWYFIKEVKKDGTTTN